MKNAPLGAVLLAASIGQKEREGDTSFSKLSKEAQDLIVRATCGEFDNAPPPNLPDSVRDEIREWAEEPDPESEPNPLAPK